MPGQHSSEQRRCRHWSNAAHGCFTRTHAIRKRGARGATDTDSGSGGARRRPGAHGSGRSTHRAARTSLSLPTHPQPEPCGSADDRTLVAAAGATTCDPDAITLVAVTAARGRVGGSGVLMVVFPYGLWYSTTPPTPFSYVRRCLGSPFLSCILMLHGFFLSSTF